MNPARLSVATPVVTMLPGFSTDWEKDPSLFHEGVPPVFLLPLAVRAKGSTNQGVVPGK
jgi:hypothetical protein